MAEKTTQTMENLLSEAQMSGEGFQSNVPNFQSRISAQQSTGLHNNEEVIKQVHPIFLTTYADPKTKPIEKSKFDKVLDFLRLMLEWMLKAFDIMVDAAVQIVKVGVWCIAILGVLIVVTLMTNTTDKFIDLLNQSVFRAIWSDIQIQKVDSNTTASPTNNSSTTGTGAAAGSTSSRTLSR